MKKLYGFLKTLLYCCVGVFIGTSLYRIWDYKTNAWVYDMQAVPFYMYIVLNAAILAAEAVVILLVMWLLRRKMRREAQTAGKTGEKQKP